MAEIGKKLSVSTAPYLHSKDTTPWMMFQIVFVLIPIFLIAYYYFGLSTLLISLTAITSCLLTEWYFDKLKPRGKSLKDGSALITGMLLALTLPPGFPLWMVFLGGVVAIGMGKVIWGGLGQNIFNPALLGRAFLQAAFPTAITTWAPPDGRYFASRGGNFALPFYQSENVDGYSMATPLASMKFDQIPTDIMQLFFGNTSGSLGETCGVLFIMAGLYLVVRKIINWRIPVSILLAVGIFSGILYLIDPQIYPSPWFMILSGGLLLGVVFMATDPVSSPLTVRGVWIFGVGIGFLVVLIRVWGGLPEGVMYAILLMNAATPLINRFSKSRVYGHK